VIPEEDETAKYKSFYPDGTVVEDLEFASDHLSGKADNILLPN